MMVRCISLVQSAIVRPRDLSDAVSMLSSRMILSPRPVERIGRAPVWTVGIDAERGDPATAQHAVTAATVQELAICTPSPRGDVVQAFDGPQVVESGSNRSELASRLPQAMTLAGFHGRPKCRISETLAHQPPGSLAYASPRRHAGQVDAANLSTW